MNCDICHHTLDNNRHGLDQNDGYIDDEGNLILYGTCTYCGFCNGRLVNDDPTRLS